MDSMQHGAGPKLNRLVRQHLESLWRAGLTHLPTAGVAMTDDLEVRKISGTSRQTGEMSSSSVSVPSTAKSILSLAERQQELRLLADKVATCVRCQELASTRTQTVFGVGNAEASLMFIGEAPGADEDRQGEPFVGAAGKLMNRIIEACRMKREEIYICNILRCRPPGNRNPTAEEAANCREYLNRQIAIVDPDYIVCWGSVAAHNLLDTSTPIGKLRGRFMSYGRTKVLCTYHPSYLLRTPSAKTLVWEDMKFLLRDMDVDWDFE